MYYKLSGNELYVSNKSTSVVANIVDDNKVSYQIIDDVSSVAGYSGTEASVGVQSALSDEVETEDSSEVTVSYDVKAIGEGSFEGSSIQSVVLPEGITSIGDRAFANSSSLTNLTVSNDKDSDDDAISTASIDDCNDAVVAVLPSTVTSIGAQAFSSCVAIKDLDIPSSVQSIGDDAFQGMGADTTIHVHTATAYEQAVAACSNSKATVVYGTSDDKYTYDMSGVAFDGATFEYDGSPHSVFVSGDLPDGVSVSYSGNGVVDSGRHTVTASFEVDEGACNPIPDMTAEMTVVKKPGYISFAQPFVTKIYGIGSFDNQVKKLGDGAVYYSSSNPSIVSVDVSGTLKVRGVGRATVTAGLAEGKNYLSSSTSFSVVVNPEGTKITKLIKKKKGFTAKWSKRTTQTDGYQIRYSAKKNMTKSKSVVVGKAKTVTKAIKKLKKKTTYYVQIRTYKKVGGVKFYSAWSSSKKVKTK